MFFSPAHVLILVGCCITGLALFSVGLRGLATGRPFLIRSFYFSSCVAAGPLAIAAPITVFWFAEGLSRIGDRSVVLLLIPLAIVYLVVLMFAQYKGYFGLGMTSTALRGGLLAALHELKIPHVERLSVVELPEHHASLEVASCSWIGTAQIRSSGPGGKHVLPGVIKAMNQHYSHEREPTALVSCASFTVAGTVILGLAVWLSLDLYALGRR